MTLRRTLLLAFLLLGLLPSAALSWLSFTRTRDAMTHEIQQNLVVQARSIQSDIDQMLFERFENASVWARSELMEDLRLGDVDKRVTHYLVGLQQGYGDVYAALDCVDAHGQIIASSSAARIGTRAAVARMDLLSLSSPLAANAAALALPDSMTLDERAPLVITAPIPSAYAARDGRNATLSMAMNVMPISRLLDAAAQDKRVIVVVDGQGRWVAASRPLRGHSRPDAPAQAWTRRVVALPQLEALDHSPWVAERALTGRATSKAMPGFGGSGWTTLVLEPVDEALAPVSHMAVEFASLFVLVLIATVLAAGWVAAAMSRPIVTLTEHTRRYREASAPPAADRPTSAIREVEQLARAYDEMILSLEQSRRELVGASKRAMLGELGAVLAHEVRTPLGILRSSAQILMRNPALDADGLELMRFIESETERLNRLVSTLLDTARPAVRMATDCDLHDLLRQCALMHDLKDANHPASPGSVRLELNAQAVNVVADPEQLKQVFFNLLSNATEAAGPAGQVVVSTLDGPGEICIDFEDSGPGVAPELHAAIFEPFISRRAGGLGLGLAVVRQIVAAHEGAIQVGRSRWGGARFTVSLPQPATGVPQ